VNQNSQGDQKQKYLEPSASGVLSWGVAKVRNQASDAALYDESKIKTLSSLEHIRLRTGMYIGRLGDGSNPDDGIYVLVKEIVDNSVDEFIMGAGNRILVSVNGDTVRIRDFGRGIPLGKVIDCVSTINTGAKYNDDVFSVLCWPQRRRHQGRQRSFAHIPRCFLSRWQSL